MITKPINLDKLESKDPKIRYGFVKELLKTGAVNPALLYDHLDYWEKLSVGNNNILKWTAIDIIGYLSAVDKENRTDRLIAKLLMHLHGGHLITCNHAIFALGLIAKNKQVYRAPIIQELLAISKDTFETEECKNIATGKVLETLKEFPGDIRNNKDAIDFIEKAKSNKRYATAKKASALLNNLVSLTNPTN